MPRLQRYGHHDHTFANRARIIQILCALTLAGCQGPMSTVPEFLPFVTTDGGIEVPLVTVWTVHF